MFAHPTPTPAGYYPGPPPPMQYPGGAYDPAAMAHPAPYPPQPGYYGVPPPQSFGPPQPAPAPSPNGAGPHSPVQHTTAYSAPPSAVAENGIPPQLPPPVPYVMPNGYAPNGAPMMGGPAISIPVVPFPQQQGPPSPTHHRKESSAAYGNNYQPQTPASAGPQENGKSFANGTEEGGRPFPPRTDYGRRSGFRRISFGGPKQPCLFFPAGKCKNGYD